MLTFGVSFASCNNIINLIPSIQYLPPTFIYSRSNCFYSFACGTIFLHYIRIDRSYLQRLLNGKIIVLKNMLVKKVHLTKSFLHMFFLIKIVYLIVNIHWFTKNAWQPDNLTIQVEPHLCSLRQSTLFSWGSIPESLVKKLKIGGV